MTTGLIARPDPGTSGHFSLRATVLPSEHVTLNAPPSTISAPTADAPPPSLQLLQQPDNCRDDRDRAYAIRLLHASVPCGSATSGKITRELRAGGQPTSLAWSPSMMNVISFSSSAAPMLRPSSADIMPIG